MDSTEHYTVSSLCGSAGQGGFASQVPGWDCGHWSGTPHFTVLRRECGFVFFFLTKSRLWQPFIKQVYQCQFFNSIVLYLGFPGGSDSKESACNAGDPSSTPGLGRSPGEENRDPLLCSCLENPMDRGDCGATVHGVTKSRTQLSD